MYVIKCDGQYWTDGGEWGALSDACTFDDSHLAIKHCLDEFPITEVTICEVKVEFTVIMEWGVMKEVE